MCPQLGVRMWVGRSQAEESFLQGTISMTHGPDPCDSGSCKLSAVPDTSLLIYTLWGGLESHRLGGREEWAALRGLWIQKHFSIFTAEMDGRSSGGSLSNSPGCREVRTDRRKHYWIHGLKPGISSSSLRLAEEQTDSPNELKTTEFSFCFKWPSFSQCTAQGKADL